MIFILMKSIKLNKYLDNLDENNIYYNNFTSTRQKYNNFFGAFDQF